MHTAKRQIQYDVLRIIAILCVLYNHRSCFDYYTKVPMYSAKYWFVQIMAILIKSGPPLFFMISGALLLGKKEPAEKVYKKRVPRILWAMVLIGIPLTCELRQPISKYPLNVLGSLNWYLYSYLAFLVVLPFLRVMFQNMEDDLLKLLIGISSVLYLLTTFVMVFNLPGNFLEALRPVSAVWPANTWHLLFPVLGWYLSSKTDSSDKNLLGALLIGTIISTLFFAVLTTWDLNHTGGANLEQYRERAALLPTCFLFYGVRMLCESENAISNFLHRHENVITLLGSLTFGIFLIETHTYISNRIEHNIGLLLTPVIGSYPVAILCIFLEFALYGLITWLLRLIPPMRKVL